MRDVNFFGKKLTSLKGRNIPDIIDGQFNCSNNNLKSLEFGPRETTDDYLCVSNKLSSLKFGPVKVGADFYCSQNRLTSLEFGPVEIVNDYVAETNKIEHLSGAHKYFKNGYIKGALWLDGNPVKSHLLSVILIPQLIGIMGIETTLLQKIINKHLETERDVLECQEELIQNGFKEFAQL